MSDSESKRTMTLKQEWLTYSTLNRTPEEVWLRHKIAKLFDLEAPTESQRHLRQMADLHQTFGDIPGPPNHDAEMKSLALEEFGPPPRVLIPTVLILLLLAWMQRRGLA